MRGLPECRVQGEPQVHAWQQSPLLLVLHCAVWTRVCLHPAEDVIEWFWCFLFFFQFSDIQITDWRHMFVARVTFGLELWLFQWHYCRLKSAPLGVWQVLQRSQTFSDFFYVQRSTFQSVVLTHTLTILSVTEPNTFYYTFINVFLTSLLGIYQS